MVKENKHRFEIVSFCLKALLHNHLANQYDDTRSFINCIKRLNSCKTYDRNPKSTDCKIACALTG